MSYFRGVNCPGEMSGANFRRTQVRQHNHCHRALGKSVRDYLSPMIYDCFWNLQVNETFDVISFKYSSRPYKIKS